MNLLTVSAIGLGVFAAYLIIVQFLLRLFIGHFPESGPAQGLAALIG